MRAWGWVAFLGFSGCVLQFGSCGPSLEDLEALCNRDCRAQGTNRRCIEQAPNPMDPSEFECVDLDHPCAPGKSTGCFDDHHRSGCVHAPDGGAFLRPPIGAEVCTAPGEICHDTATSFECSTMRTTFCVPQYFPQCDPQGTFVRCQRTGTARYVVVPDPCPCSTDGGYCFTCKGDAGSAYCG